MRALESRALPDGRVQAGDARLFGFVLSIGPRVLAAHTSRALLALCGAHHLSRIYRSATNIPLDAVPHNWGCRRSSDGAPPTAASLGGAALFAIVFLGRFRISWRSRWMYP
jgi:hypothetical protein